jgi:hypothetical protein
MHRSATSRAREFRLKAPAGARRKAVLRGDAAEPYRRILLALGDGEMAERVVSDVVVQECLLSCGVPWRGCGIPADDLCLLAMQGAAGARRLLPRRLEEAELLPMR